MGLEHWHKDLKVFAHGRCVVDSLYVRLQGVAEGTLCCSRQEPLMARLV